MPTHKKQKQPKPVKNQLSGWEQAIQNRKAVFCEIKKATIYKNNDAATLE